MKRFSVFYIAFTLFAAFYISGCIESTSIGGDILRDDEINVEFIDTTTLIMKSVKNDSIRVFPSTLNIFLLGTLQNDEFGKESASLYCNFKTNGLIPEDNFEIDSVVLSLIVDTLVYGNKAAFHEIKVYELEENIETDDNLFYSNSEFQHTPSLLGSKVISSIADSVTVIEPEGDTIKYFEQIRINLDKTLGERIFSDTNTLKNDTLFKELFKGLYIESVVNGENSILNLKAIDSKNQNITKIEVYYTAGSKLKSLKYFIDKSVSHFEHNYQSSEVIEYFNDTIKADSFLYIQGMEGVKLNVDIPDFEYLKNKNINKAELVFYVVENDNLGKLPSKIITTYEDFEGNIVAIDDYKESGLSGGSFYGGTVEEIEIDGVNVKRYIINLTLHIRHLLNTENYRTNISIEPFNRKIDPGFVKFYGVKNDKYKPKLNILFSNIN